MLLMDVILILIDAYVHREGEIVLLKSTEMKGDSN